MRTLCFLAAFNLIASLASAAADSARVVWDASSARAVQPGGYARVRVLSDHRLALVCSEGNAVIIRFSRDEGRTWEPAVKVAEHAGCADTNSELIELKNGWLLYGFNSRPNHANQGVLPYVIRTILSKDGGRTWTEERDAFTGGKISNDGCWEPAFLQLPSGDVELYFANEAPYTTSNEQEISLLRSKDNGLTWSTPTTASFRQGSRDGMPVPVLLNDGRTIAVAIEDNGFHGTFKPVIVRTTLAADWSDGPVLADSPRRSGALRSDVALDAEIYAGAPYLAQLPTGETLLVVQSTAGRKRNTDRFAQAVVYVGNSEARDFAQPTVPFPNLPADASADWNSLTVLDRDTVMLISTFEGVPSPVGPVAVWTILGHIVR
jgi:hypothetical protein